MFSPLLNTYPNTHTQVFVKKHSEFVLEGDTAHQLQKQVTTIQEIIQLEKDVHSLTHTHTTLTPSLTHSYTLSFSSHRCL